MLMINAVCFCRPDESRGMFPFWVVAAVMHEVNEGRKWRGGVGTIGGPGPGGQRTKESVRLQLEVTPKIPPAVRRLMSPPHALRTGVTGFVLAGTQEEETSRPTPSRWWEGAIQCLCTVPALVPTDGGRKHRGRGRKVRPGLDFPRKQASTMRWVGGYEAGTSKGLHEVMAPWDVQVLPKVPGPGPGSDPRLWWLKFKL